MKDYVIKYLKKTGVDSVSELSDEQVVYFFKEENKDNPIGLGCCAVDYAMKFGGIKKEDIVKSMRKAMKTYTFFGCGYITGESAFGGEEDIKEGWYIVP